MSQPVQPAMVYQPARVLAGRGSQHFDHGLRGLTVDRNDAVYAVGDSRVQVFEGPGRSARQWPTEFDGYSVAVAGDGGVWVGEAQQVEIFDPAGALLDTWRDGERLGLVTAVGFTAGQALFADATARWIRRFDRGGRFLGNIGDKHRKGGFHIPNGVVDFAVDADDVIHVANPGMHRVERYTAEGELLGHFGRFDGVDPQGFPGCCNPTNLALARDGRVMVSEKAPPRVKVYGPEGDLLAVVAGGEAFDAAAKNMDVAVDSRERIFVADTARRRICVFAPAAEERT